MSVLTSLNPAQWQLLLRARARGGLISDVQSWMWAANAECGDVLELQEATLVFAMLGDSRVRVEFLPNGTPDASYEVRLTGGGKRRAAALAEQHKVLAYLDNFTTEVSMKAINPDATRWQAMVELDAAGLLVARRIGLEQAMPLTTWQRTLGRGVVVRITAMGRRYAGRVDV